MFMKKVRLFSLLSLVLAGCSSPLLEAPQTPESIVSASEARAFSFPTSTITYAENYADTRVLAGIKAEVLYSSSQEMGYSQVYIHYGFNGWKAIGEAPVTISNPSSPYIHTQIAVPSWATSLDYVFYSVQADGSKLWDNNRGRDWHVKVFNASVETLPGVDTITIHYISKFGAAQVHWGLNGWKSVQDTPMEVKQSLPGGYKKYQAVVKVNFPQDLVDFCFTNGQGAWDNNGGKNWLTSIETQGITVYPSNNGSFLQSDLMGAPLKVYLDEKYIGDMNLGGGTTYFFAYMKNVPGNYRFVLDTIAGGNRYTGEVSGLVTKGNSFGITVNTQAWGF